VGARWRRGLFYRPDDPRWPSTLIFRSSAM